jgi:hypothetical protein
MYDKPLHDFDTMMDQGILPAQMLVQMSAWSREKGQLARWLSDRRSAHRTRLNLVIWDNTGFRIPWEMFWVPRNLASTHDGGFLGVVMTVTRWHDQGLPFPESFRLFAPRSGQATGGVAAYIDRSMSRDRSLLSDFDVKDVATMESLLAYLMDETAEPLALVYVACHGQFGSSLVDWRLGGLSYTRASYLADCFHRLYRNPALVFLNACNSGSADWEGESYYDRALHGFAEVFLRGGAGGVLATTARIGDHAAYEAARDLLEYLRQNPATPVAEALRELRARAVDRVPRDLLETYLSEGDQKWEMLPTLSWFMYVYYGSPFMTISISADRGSRAARP